MKNILFLLLAGWCLSVSGQDEMTSGCIEYEMLRKLEIRIQEENSEMDGMFPREMKFRKELLFTPASSLFRNVTEETGDEIMQESAGGNTMIIKMRVPEEIIYSDLRSKINTEQREFMTRNFLIEMNTDTARWKLTGNRKKVLDFECLEAELTGSPQKTSAWFAPSIPVSTGPEGYGGLPGLILALELEDGKRVYSAQHIDFRAIGNGEIARPGQGKKITREEFNRIVAEKRKEMEQSGEGGVFIRKIER